MPERLSGDKWTWKDLGPVGSCLSQSICPLREVLLLTIIPHLAITVESAHAMAVKVDILSSDVPGRSLILESKR